MEVRTSIAESLAALSDCGMMPGMGIEVTRFEGWLRVELDITPRRRSGPSIEHRMAPKDLTKAQTAYVIAEALDAFPVSKIEATRERLTVLVIVHNDVTLQELDQRRSQLLERVAAELWPASSEQ